MTIRPRILGALAVLALAGALISTWFVHHPPPAGSSVDPSDTTTATAIPKPTRLDADVGHSSSAPTLVADPAKIVDRIVVSPAADDDDIPCWIQVVDFASGAPLDHVTITAELGVDQAITYTDVHGYAHVDSSKTKPRLLQLDLAGYSTLFLAPEVGHERADRALRSSMSRTATLRAHVRGATGAALQDTQVTLEAGDIELRLRHLTRPDGVDPTSESISSNTDASGNATLSNLPAGVAFLVTVFTPKQWSPADRIVLQPGEVRDVDWTLSGGCTLRGLLLDQDDRPVIRRRVWMTRAWIDHPAYFVLGQTDNMLQSTTDDAGKFMFAELDPASWWTGPAPNVPDESATLDPAQDVAPLAQLVRIEAGRLSQDVTLHVDRGLYIRGHVVDSAGAPIADVPIHALDREHGLHARSSSHDPDGSFAIGPLMRGAYTLSTNRQTNDAAAEPVVAEAGQSGVLVRLRAGAALSGQVVGNDGVGVSAALRVTDPTADPETSTSIHTDQNGRFAVRGLTSGVFDLVATTDDGRIGFRERVRVNGGQVVKDLVVHVTKGGRIRIRNAGSEPSVEVRVFYRGVLVGWSYAHGNLPVDVMVPAGTNVVRAHYVDGDGRVVERSVTVDPEVTVDLVLESGAK